MRVNENKKDFWGNYEQGVWLIDNKKNGYVLMQDYAEPSTKYGNGEVLSNEKKEFERGELQMAAHHIDHLLMLLRVGVGILLKYRIGDIIRTLHITNHTTSVEVVCATRRREVQESAGEDQRRTGNTHVYLLNSLVQ